MAGRALIVSVNDYRLVDSSGQMNLRGCYSDGMNYHRMFKWQGFDEIRWLKDKEATAQAILDGCRWLQEGTREKGTRPRRGFAYAGHGSIYKGRPCLVPADMAPDWGNALTFPRLGRALAFPETVVMAAFLDCCHSGDRVRQGLNHPNEEFANPSPRPRFLPPPEDHQAPFGCEMLEDGDRVAPKADSSYQINSDCNVVLTGCERAQTSADAWLDNHFTGAFTWCLMRILEKSQGKITYRDLIAQIRKMLKSKSFEQNPTYQGPPQYAGLSFLEEPSVKKDDGIPEDQAPGRA